MGESPVILLLMDFVQESSMAFEAIRVPLLKEQITFLLLIYRKFMC